MLEFIVFFIIICFVFSLFKNPKKDIKDPNYAILYDAISTNLKSLSYLAARDNYIKMIAKDIMKGHFSPSRPLSDFLLRLNSSPSFNFSSMINSNNAKILSSTLNQASKDAFLEFSKYINKIKIQIENKEKSYITDMKLTAHTYYDAIKHGKKAK